MITADRRGWVEQSIRSYQAQDFAEKELIVVDDGEDSVQDLVAGENIHYIHCQPTTLAEKRNIALDAAAGKFIAIWDDDDWWRQNRLSIQVAALQNHPKKNVCIFKSLLCHDIDIGDTWIYQPPDTSWLDCSAVFKRHSARMTGAGTGETIRYLSRYPRWSWEILWGDPYVGIHFRHKRCCSPIFRV